MAVHMKLSDYLQTLDFMGARNSQDYVGTKLDNPAMILEDNILTWIKLTDLEDLQECFRVFEENVCVCNFPARYSAQFWLAHATLTTVYTVLSYHLEHDGDEETKTAVDNLLFELWCRLIGSGPGSSHLEMMDLILKYPHFPLWKYLQNLHGGNLTVLVSTLKTDFVYVEQVSADHYATLMETHIDKIFKVILSDRQMEEARRELLDLYLFYLSRMNHVPPHIGPRLSHLCFLICNRYKLENPYMGYDDWVLLRHHMKTIKDVITNPTFTVASEAQYRAPLTLEKIFQAAVADQMLNIMFKDFMTLLLTICQYDNSKKCKRLFAAYQTGLFELIDFKKDFETTPTWMFDQCIQTLGKLSKTISMETHIDEFIISAQHLILEKFTKLSSGQVSSWHELMVNYLVSGRTLLIKEAGNLLNSSILKNNNGLNWKTYCDQGKLFIDIISDIPGAFLQTDEHGSPSTTIQGYVTFVQVLLDQIIEFEFEGRVRQNVHQCLLHCLEKECGLKAAISSVCVHSIITNLADTDFIRDVLFSIDTLLKDPGCPSDDKTLTDVIITLLKACLELFRSKGYIGVDLNSLFMSICMSCLTAHTDVTSQQDELDPTIPSHDISGDVQSCDVSGHQTTDLWTAIYQEGVQTFLELHINKGTVRSIASLVPQIVLAIDDSLQKQGTIPTRCIDFLSVMSSKCFQFVSDHVTRLIELFLDCWNISLLDLLLVMYEVDDGAFLSMFPDIYTQTLQAEHDYRHAGMKLLLELSKNHPELFLVNHVCQLLGTYSTETECTQGYILNIVLNVTRYNTSIVAGYFSILVDDSKFDELSLPQRAPILTRLAQHSEELWQRTVEYLMKFIGNKDENISTVAMETLFPLIKDKPGFIHRQKVKLKNIWKVTKNAQVKSMCAKLVPEVSSTGKAPIAKAVPSRSNTDSKRVANPSVKATVVVGKKVQDKRPVKDTSVKQVTNISVKQVKETSVKELKDTAVTKEKGTAVSQGKDTMMVQPPNLKQPETDLTAEEEPVDETLEIQSSVEDEKDKVTEASVLNKDVKAVPQGDSHEVQHSEAGGDTVANNVENQVLTGSTTATVPNEAVKEHGEVGTEVLDKSDEKQCVDKVEIQVPGQENVVAEALSSETVNTDKDSTVNPPTSKHSEPYVYLYHTVGCSAFTNQLSKKLKMAGYDNVVKALNEDCEDDLTGAKVVVICAERFDETGDQPLTKQMSRFQQAGLPVICLRTRPLTRNGTVQLYHTGGHRSIRFYTKPGEETIQGTSWPKYKFCELLMQLNYNGIMRDDKLLTSEFRSLWENRADEKEKHLKKSFDDRSFLLPDIFVSYHWGKQRQVEPLYSHLMGEGLLCWMGGYQMDGSESLYNKIQQGLQSCRVVLACVTKKYEQCEICQCDIKTASRLGRVIVPVLIDDCQWPLGGEVGAILQESDPIKLKSVYNVQQGFLPSGMKKLISKLKHFTVTNRDDHILEIPSEIRSDAIDEDDTDEDSDENIDDFDDDSNFSNRSDTGVTKNSKNSKLLEFSKRQTDQDVITRRHSHAVDVVGPGITSETTWSEDGHPLRASRSKSCILL